MRLVRPSNAMAMLRLVEAMQATQPTYGDLGATLAGRRPEGFRHDCYQTDLGFGQETFQRAVAGLKAWEAHRLPGMRVFPHRQHIQPGATVAVTLGAPFLALLAPCRIIDVIDEEHRWGFAYGTLPGHPERGEEAFVVSISQDETVRFEVVVFSRPADLLVRLSGPICRTIQKGGTKGYLRALRQFVAEKSEVR
jgi:uncharacterized protein (UPF0548 family)